MTIHWAWAGGIETAWCCQGGIVSMVLSGPMVDYGTLQLGREDRLGQMLLKWLRPIKSSRPMEGYMRWSEGTERAWNA